MNDDTIRALLHLETIQYPSFARIYTSYPTYLSTAGADYCSSMKILLWGVHHIDNLFLVVAAVSVI